MAEYFLNGKKLSDFGVLPGRSKNHHLAVTGGFDLPKRIGTTHYDWKLENSVEPFVNADDMVFGEREIKFSGTIVGNINANIQALNQYIGSLPEIFPFSSKWGTWKVKLRKEIQITPIDRDNSAIEIYFTEPLPDLTGSLPLSTTPKDIDDYNWQSFGLRLESISEGQYIGAQKSLNVTQNPSYTIPSMGGYEKTGITVRATFVCSDFDDFKTKVSSLYPLIGGAGLRKIRYRGIEYSCFAVEGFTVSDIIFSDRIIAKFQCKLIVTEKVFI